MDLYIRENYLKKIRGFYHADDLIKVITGVRRPGSRNLKLYILTLTNENIETLLRRIS